MLPYEEDVRIPMFVVAPKALIGGDLAPSFGAAKVVDGLVLNIDFAPAFLDLAGAPKSKTDAMDGVSCRRNRGKRAGGEEAAPRLSD